MQDLETIIAANRLQLTWEARSYGPVQESSVVDVDVPDLTRAGAVFRPTFLVTRNRVSPTVFHNWAIEAQAMVVGNTFGNALFWALEEIIYEGEKEEVRPFPVHILPEEA